MDSFKLTLYTPSLYSSRLRYCSPVMILYTLCYCAQPLTTGTLTYVISGIAVADGPYQHCFNGLDLRAVPRCRRSCLIHKKQYPWCHAAHARIPDFRDAKMQCFQVASIILYTAASIPPRPLVQLPLQLWPSPPLWNGGTGVLPPETFLNKDNHFGAFWCILSQLIDWLHLRVLLQFFYSL